MKRDPLVAAVQIKSHPTYMNKFTDVSEMLTANNEAMIALIMGKVSPSEASVNVSMISLMMER
jgi:hypothetical protein